MVARAIKTKKVSEVAFLLVAKYKLYGVFKYPKVFEGDNGSKFKNYVIRWLGKHKVDILRTNKKYKRIDWIFVEAFNKELEKQSLKPMHSQEWQGSKKVSEKTWRKL